MCITQQQSRSDGDKHFTFTLKFPAPFWHCGAHANSWLCTIVAALYLLFKWGIIRHYELFLSLLANRSERSWGESCILFNCWIFLSSFCSICYQEVNPAIQSTIPVPWNFCSIQQCVCTRGLNIMQIFLNLSLSELVFYLDHFFEELWYYNSL